jgi:hypothetical protein
MRCGSSLGVGGADSTGRTGCAAGEDPASQYAAANPAASPAPIKSTVLNIPASVREAPLPSLRRVRREHTVDRV